MNASDASESGSNGDTFVDPETGEVGHIIRNPFGVANPEGVDTGIDIPENAGEEVGGIITSPFGVPASDDIDTGVDVLDEDEEYLISLPDDEESEVEESENVDEVDDETSDDEKEIEDESAETTTEKYVPVVDNPTRGGEYPSFNFQIRGKYGNEEVWSSTDTPGANETLFVPAGQQFTVSVYLTEGNFPTDNPTWSVVGDSVNPALPAGVTDITDISISNGTINQSFETDSHIPWGNYTLSVSCNSNGLITIRSIRVIIRTLRMTIRNPFIPANVQNPGYDSILVTNIGDESNDGQKPDYANFAERENETSLLIMDMEIDIGNFNRNNCKILFEYDGISDITGLVATSINDDPQYADNLQFIYNLGAKEYWDYSSQKTDEEIMRVWTSSKPQMLNGKWTVNSSLNDETSARNSDRYGTEQGNFFAPKSEPSSAYCISDLFPETPSSHVTKRFYIEGINPDINSPVKEITATLIYNNANMWINVASTTIKLYILEGKVIVNTNNDPFYELNEDDHIIKNQHGGFKGWFAQALSETIDNSRCTHGLENLFPVLLKDLSPLPSGMKYVVKINHNGVILDYPTSHFGGGRMLDYIKNGAMANYLCNLYRDSPSTLPNFKEIDSPNIQSDFAFLFGIYQNPNNESSCCNSISLYLSTGDTTDELLLLDASLYTFTRIDNLFEMWSTRGNGTANYTWTYPTERGRSIPSFETFPDAVQDMSFAVTRDNSRDVFLFLHGYNVTESEAKDFNRIMYRRMYWSGYRNNFIGLTWHGDDLDFDSDIYHAFQSSRAIREFINSIPSSQNLCVAAHSLGNVAMWDALRLHSLLSPSRTIQNVISIEGAVWEESFYPVTAGMDYTSATDPGHVMYYSPVDLEYHSWAHWFRPSGHDALSNVVTFTNSRTTDDDILIYLKRWNSFSVKYNHYNRALSAFRTPQRESLPEYVALLKTGHRIPRTSSNYLSYYENLTDPIGLTDLPTHPKIINFNVNIPHFSIYSGWRPNQHNDMKNAMFYNIHNWFNIAFKRYANLF